MEEVPTAVFRQVMETNFFGALRCIKAVIPGMRERRHGCIINVTSISGRVALAPQAPYAASKWAFEALSECLAQEMKAFNIRVADRRTRRHRDLYIQQGHAGPRR